MKRITYSRYTGEDFGISAEDLLQALADYLLQSGFRRYEMGFSEWDEHTLEALKEAMRRALEQGLALDPEEAERFEERLLNLAPEDLDRLVDRLVQKLIQEGYLNVEEPPPPVPEDNGGIGERQARVRFEITDKSIDFLGYKTLKDLLGSLGKASFGAHDTRELAKIGRASCRERV